MFRLLPRGLPKDPEYPSDLEGLGYFINEDDEVRNIEEPKYYFKYFLTRNDRHNERQREAMSTAIRNIVINRLKFHGMEAVRLPLGTKADEPHIPILVSKNIDSASRVIILFGETYQDLAIFAQRICGGHGGINAGSAVDFVKYIQGLPSDPNIPSSSSSATEADGDSKTDGNADTKAKPHELNPNHPGIILANMGQLRWCRREQRALTYMSWNALTRPSAVHDPVTFDFLRNTVEHNRGADEHAAYVLSTVVPALCHKDAKLDVIAIGDSGLYVTQYLDENWDAAKERMQSLAVVLPTLERDMIRNEEFKVFLQKRTRGYIMSESPVSSGIYGPGGGPEPWQWSYGMNIYSLGSEAAEEMVFPRHFRHVVDWMQDVARDAEYVNEEVVAEEMQEMEFEGVTGEDSAGWGGYKKTEEGESEWKVERAEKSDAKDADEGVNAAATPANAGESRMDLVDADGTRAATAADKEAIDEVVEASAKLTLGLDGVVDPLDITCPPERMEPLPSYIKTDESPVSVHLTKEEKAAILQISVLSSPVKEEFPRETSDATEMETGGGSVGICAGGIGANYKC